jgi:tRNA(Ile)-lysidine synthase TilS/MesJ
MQLIRPIYKVSEDAILSWKNYNDLEFIHCGCPATLQVERKGTHVPQRAETKRLIAQLKLTHPDIETNLFHSTHNVNLNTIIGYHKGTESVDDL